MAGDGEAKETSKRAKGRTLAEFGTLRPAEKMLLEACQTGEFASIADERPKEKSNDNSIRPTFLRFLTLGGDDEAPVHEKGVQLNGAWIDGDIDLESCRISAPLYLWNCTIVGQLIVLFADVHTLSLEGSKMQGIEGSGLRCRGFLFFRNCFHATGEVRLIGAHISGNLECDKNRFDGADGKALVCDGIETGGDVFLRNGFRATGEVRLLGARIGGDLVCEGGRFEAAGERSLNCNRAKIDGALDFRAIVKPDDGKAGVVAFLGAHASTLTDDAASWQTASALVLDGFTYDRIAGVPRTDQPGGTTSGDAPPRDAKTRIAWLDRQLPRHLTQDFRPQPWQQLARVLMEMGNEDDARTVLIEMRKRQRETRWKHRNASWWKRAWWFVLTRFDWVLGVLVAYGHRPQRAMWSLLGLWLAGSLIYWGVASAGIMAPTDARLYLDNQIPPECKVDWIGYAGPQLPSSAEIADAPSDARAMLQKQISDDADHRRDEATRVGLDQAQEWTWKGICDRAVPSEYSVFQPFVYSIGIMLPFLELRQERDFAPRILDDKGKVICPLFTLPSWLPLIDGTWGLGYLVRVWEWFEIFLGWTLTILIAASVSGIIKKD
ncbi:MAG TPA: hypothetical protein VK337_19070 [Xanthobacteraceae bacterium]|nr:hypothetical protein [Xanthobacteraceae bacterium]